jgi:tRNA G18 (ribose-2'-O)-methylase SpoU
MTFENPFNFNLGSYNAMNWHARNVMFENYSSCSTHQIKGLNGLICTKVLSNKDNWALKNPTIVSLDEIQHPKTPNLGAIIVTCSTTISVSLL